MDLPTAYVSRSVFLQKTPTTAAAACKSNTAPLYGVATITRSLCLRAIVVSALLLAFYIFKSQEFFFVEASPYLVGIVL